MPVCVAGATAHLAPTLDNRRTLAKATIVLSTQHGNHNHPLQAGSRQCTTDTSLEISFTVFSLQCLSITVALTLFYCIVTKLNMRFISVHLLMFLFLPPPKKRQAMTIQINKIKYDVKKNTLTWQKKKKCNKSKFKKVFLSLNK